MERNATQASITVLQNLTGLLGRRGQLEQDLQYKLGELRNHLGHPLSHEEINTLLNKLIARDWRVYRDEFEIAFGCRPYELNRIKAPVWAGDWEVGAILAGHENFRTLSRNLKKASKQRFKHHASHIFSHQNHRPKNHYTPLALRLIAMFEDAYGSRFPLTYSYSNGQYSGAYLTTLKLAMSIHLFSTSFRGKPTMNDLANLIKNNRA